MNHRKRKSPEKTSITLHACTVVPKYIDAIAGQFGVTQEVAANELMLALIGCAEELMEDGPLTEEPLKLVTESIIEVECENAGPPS